MAHSSNANESASTLANSVGSALLSRQPK